MRTFPAKWVRSAGLFITTVASFSLPAIAQMSGNYASEADDFGIAPQSTLHVGLPHAPTPLTVPGTRTITTADLYARLSARQPMILLYVNEAQDGLAINGAHWLDGAGRGSAFDDVLQARLIAKIGQLSSSNKASPIVAFCFDAHCWLSYNVVLRLLKAGYTNVSWYRGGRESWKAAGFPLATLNREQW